MKFPGKRKRKHYFPVNPDGKRTLGTPLDSDNTHVLQRQIYIVGIGQPLVDIEIQATEELLERYQIASGESVLLDDTTADRIYHEARECQLIRGEFAGGAIGNTLHNCTVLANTRAVLLGAINRNIQVGDYAYRYLCHTSSLVDMSHLMPHNKPMGRALCFVLPNGERSFGISKGCMNQLTREFVPADIIQHGSLLLLSTFLLRDPNAPIYDATLHGIQVAQEHGTPIALNLGTSALIEEDPSRWRDFLSRYVNLVAMNEHEAFALTGYSDPLLALQATLQWCDVALLTSGPRGLYVGAYSDRNSLRETDDEIHSKSIPEYNRFEYSRAMLLRDCDDPVPIYSHINPYRGGPREIRTTNGAGDAALSALLHDIAANHYHRTVLPRASKHQVPCLTYSSIAQICKYSNRVSYEVLLQNSPRLMYGLPEREDSLEESYWEM